jgi:hypothetical protein
MPADDGFGFHDDEDLGPAGPEVAESGPEEPVQSKRQANPSVPASGSVIH